MTFFHYIAGPLIGAIIGYITNYIAVRMLFRPLNPVYIGRFKLPFTPGIVPRRKDELAVILGKAVVDRFFGRGDLEEIFTSDYLTGAFAEGIADTLRTDASLKDLTSGIRNSKHGREQEQERSEAQAKEPDALYHLKEALCVRILAAALKVDAAKIVTDEVSEIITKHTQGALLKTLGDGLVGAIYAPLTEKIESYILNDARPVVMAMIDEEFSALAEEPVRKIADTIFVDREVLVTLISGLYTGFMRSHVRSIVSTIDIDTQITQKVREMNPAEVEALVVSVVKKELRYVVWLGALLGLIIGTVNVFI
jgi:uncharacterized membrane protein YheB (UPF0754 family)